MSNENKIKSALSIFGDKLNTQPRRDAPGTQVNIARLQDFGRDDDGKIALLLDAQAALKTASITATLRLSRPHGQLRDTNNNKPIYVSWPCLVIDGEVADTATIAEQAGMRALLAAIDAGASAEVIAALRKAMGKSETATETTAAETDSTPI